MMRAIPAGAETRRTGNKIAAVRVENSNRVGADASKLKMSRYLFGHLCAVALVAWPALSQAPALPSYTISTIAGTGAVGSSGDGSAATSATLSTPFAVAVDSAGNIYIADEFNNKVRKVGPDGTISTFAGNGTAGYGGDGGPATSAQFASPSGIAVDASGNVYISDSGNNVVRKVTTDGNVNTVAGTPTGQTIAYGGDGGPAIAAQLYNPPAWPSTPRVTFTSPIPTTTSFAWSRPMAPSPP